jgi:hypothetical protein
VSEGWVVRVWRWAFGRDAHAECRKALEQERLAGQWAREKLYEVMKEQTSKMLEVVDPGINHRLSPPQPRKEKPIAQKPSHPVLDLLPS